MYKVIQDFRGSQDGRFVTDFKIDKIVSLSPDLASIALAEKWVEKYNPEVKTEQKKTRGRQKK